MKRKSYKQKYEELLVEKHRKHYIHVPWPTWGGLGRFAAFIAATALAIGNMFIIVSLGSMLKVWELLAADDSNTVYHSWQQLAIVWPLIGEYALISIAVISFVALVKGGYNKLKPLDGAGLIGGLIGGLIVGLIGEFGD